jgi:hypothetical protein
MTPRTAQCVARVGLVMMVLCAAASAATQITYVEGPPENSWGDNMLEMGMFPLFLLAVAVEEETNLTLIGILLLHAGGFLGLTVMAAGLAMAGAGARVKEGAPRIGLWVTVVGLLIAVLCAVLVVTLDMGIQRTFGPFGAWSADATMTLQALWLLAGFVGFNLVVVGMVTAGVLALTTQPGTPGPMTPAQGLYVALIGCGMFVLCLEAGLIIPAVGESIVLVLLLCLGGFVGLVVIVVGLVTMAVPAKGCPHNSGTS